MPQPDDKRTRGSNMPRLQGQSVAPEGTSGVFNTYGVSANVAATQKTSGVEIGQQARIIDDGSSLYMALQGLAQGVERGVQQYDQWETRVAEKKQNDWETELIEFGRTVNNNPKKMAEWARIKGYRPNHKTARRYNSLMADMEGKEYDAYQDDIIRDVNAAASKMDMATAARYYAEQMAQLDPTDKAYNAFSTQTNELNKRMTAVSNQYNLAQTGQGYDVGIFDLGQMLRDSGVTSADLDNDRANVVAAAYNFFGNNPERLSISPDGTIHYTTADQSASYVGSFRGGLSDDLIQALRADLGAAAGSMEDGSFNSRIAKNVLLAIEKGRFNRQHTARGGGSGSKVMRLDAFRRVLADPAFSVNDQRAVFVDGISLAGEATEQQRKTHTSKYLRESVDSIIASDMSAQQQIEALNNFILVANPENNSVQYEQNGYAGDLESTDITGPLEKAREHIRTLNLQEGKRIGSEVQARTMNSLDSSQIRSERAKGIGELLKRFTVVGDSGAPPTINLGDGTTLTGIDQMRDHFIKHPDAAVDAVIHIVDNGLTTPDDLGNGVWMGKAGSTPPKSVTDWQRAQRENFAAVQNVNETTAAMDMGREVNPVNAVAAVDTIISKLGPNPTPSQLAPVVGIMLGGAGRQNWTKQTRAEMNKRIMDNTSSGHGEALQRAYAITAEEAYEWSKLSPEQIQHMANQPEMQETLAKFQVIEQLMADDSTREVGKWLTGDTNGNAAWYLTEGRRLSASYKEFYGEEPNRTWLTMAQGFEDMPAIMESASGMVSTLFASGTDTDNLMLALMSDNVSNVPDVIMARQLQNAWNSSLEEGGPKFLEILQTPAHPDRAALENWTQRYVQKMTSAAALQAMINTDAYEARSQQRRNQAAGGLVLNNEAANEEQLAEMWTAAATAVGPPTGSLMSIDVADRSTVGTLDNGVHVDTRTQAIVGGVRYLQTAITTRRGAGLKTFEGDTRDVLSQLGLSARMTGEPTIDNQVIQLMAEGDIIGARSAFVGSVRTNSRAKWSAFMANMEEIFPPAIDRAANQQSTNMSDAHFRIDINPLRDVPDYVRELIEKPFDDPANPILKFTRSAPRGQSGPFPEEVKQSLTYDRSNFAPIDSSYRPAVVTTAEALVGKP
jgi:hypothetical protein